MDLEMNIYKETQDFVFKIVKINEQVWHSSMDAYLPPGEQFIKKAIKLCLASPFTFNGH